MFSKIKERNRVKLLESILQMEKRQKLADISKAKLDENIANAHYDTHGNLVFSPRSNEIDMKYDAMEKAVRDEYDAAINNLKRGGG